MNSANAAQVEALRLTELKDTLNQLQMAVGDLACSEMIIFKNLEVGTQIDQARLKLWAAIQTINWQLRSL